MIFTQTVTYVLNYTLKNFTPQKYKPLFLHYKPQYKNTLLLVNKEMSCFKQTERYLFLVNVTINKRCPTADGDDSTFYRISYFSISLHL